MLNQLLYLALLSSIGTQAIEITGPSSGACVCSGESVVLNCTATVERPMFGGGTTTEIVAQRWEVTKVSEPVFVVDSSSMTSIPAGYEFVFAAPGQPTGLRVLSPDISFNQATFTCTGYDELDDSVQPLSAPPVTLEVADLSEFSCSVSCESSYSSANNMCTVMWTRPTAGSCSTLTGFAVIVTDDRNAEVSSDTLHFIIGALEPSQTYTAIITAMSSCGNERECSHIFTTPTEEKPTEFSITLMLVDTESIIINIQFTDTDHPRVAYYSVAIDQELHEEMFLGDSLSLSLKISSLQQCVNYTVSVTATNTGGSRTASATLTLDFDTSVDVSCIAGEDSCYLVATCATDLPGLAGGCSLNYTSDGRSSTSQPVVSPNGELTLRDAVPCDNQTVSYEGQVLSRTMTTLGCVHNGMTTCPSRNDCETLLPFLNGSVTYSTTGTLTNGIVATYSCDDGYELVGEETRTCLVDGTWTGAEPQCIVPTTTTPTSAPFSLPGWAIAIIMIIIILLVVGVAAVVALVLFWQYKLLSNEQDQVEMSENVSYGPLPARKKQATSSSAGGGGVSVQGSTQAPEYEEIGPAVPPRMF